MFLQCYSVALYKRLFSGSVHAGRSKPMWAGESEVSHPNHPTPTPFFLSVEEVNTFLLKLI